MPHLDDMQYKIFFVTLVLASFQGCQSTPVVQTPNKDEKAISAVASVVSYTPDCYHMDLGDDGVAWMDCVEVVILKPDEYKGKRLSFEQGGFEIPEILKEAGSIIVFELPEIFFESPTENHDGTKELHIPSISQISNLKVGAYQDGARNGE